MMCVDCKDVITDMTAYASEELHLSNVDAVNVHAGMLYAARNIRQRLVGNVLTSRLLYSYDHWPKIGHSKRPQIQIYVHAKYTGSNWIVHTIKKR